MGQDIFAHQQGEDAQPTLLIHDEAARATAEAAQRRLTFLAEASRVLAESLDYATTLERVARLAVPILADWCVIELLEADGGSRRVAMAHVDPAKEALSRDVRRRYPQAQQAPASIAAHVLRTGQPAVVHDISIAHLQEVAQDAAHLQLLLALGPKADMCLPLMARGRLLGTISFRLVQTARRYTAEDLLLAEELARRAALAVDNARLYSELRLSQERLRLVLDTIPHAVFWKDRHGVYSGCNVVFANALGLSPADVVGKTDEELPSIRREEAERARQSDRRVMEHNHPEYRLLEQIHRPDGSVAWLETNKVPLHDAQGQVIGILGTAQDITERKRAEDALAMRIAQMHAVQTIAEEITRELDLSTLLTLIVHRAVDLLGAAHSVLYLWDEGTHTLHPRAWCNAGEWGLSDLTLRLGEGVVGAVAQRRQGFIANAYQQSPYAHPAFIAHLGSAPIMAEPLLYRDRLMGVLAVMHAESGPGFIPQDRELLAVFAAQATIAIEKARLFEESTQRHAWLTQILDINKRIATSEDMPSLLSRIAEEATRLVGADGANIRILRGDHLVTTRQTQYGLVLPRVPALRLGEGIGGLAARDNRVLVVPDLQTHPDIPEFVKVQAAEVGLHSMVSIPIRSRNNVIGVLSANSARPRVFTEDESAALAICAEQAAIAIENTRLVDEVKARQAELEHANAVLQQEIEARQRAEEALAMRIEQMEAVRTIAAEITQELSLPTLLDLIIRRAIECVDAATEGIIYLWNAADQVLIPHACRGYGEWEEQLRAVRLKLGESLSGTVAQRRQGLIVNDYPHSPYVHPQALMAHLGYTAAMVEPLLYRNRLVGVIVLTNAGTKQPFAERDRDLLTLLAAHATIAIENARLFEESARRQVWLASILDINKRIATSEDMEHLMARIAEEATRLLEADGAMLRVRQGDQLVATPNTCYGTVLSAMRELRLGDGLASRAILEDRAIVTPDIQADPTILAVHKEQAAALGLHSMLTMPIRGSRGVVGTLHVTSRQPRHFATDEVAALSAYAEQAAIAIENTRLLAAEAERTGALERTNATLYHEIAERQRVEAEREQLIAELEARNAEMERFAYTVSHDLKSPLITIRGFLGLLEQDVLRGELERMKTDITYIQVAATTMQRLLDELLELSRIGRVINPLTAVPLSELAREAATLVGGQIVARGVQVHITPNLPVVVGDRPRLLEVLQNLLDNAIKFMGSQPAPRIEIGVRQEGEQTVCYVQDNGIGIEPRYHETVFGLFERLDSTSDGTGIGLALVKRIIEVHGGRIWVESAGQGHGSTFCFTLPSPREGAQWVP